MAERRWHVFNRLAKLYKRLFFMYTLISASQLSFSTSNWKVLCSIWSDLNFQSQLVKLNQVRRQLQRLIEGFMLSLAISVILRLFLDISFCTFLRLTLFIKIGGQQNPGYGWSGMFLWPCFVNTAHEHGQKGKRAPSGKQTRKRVHK